MWTAKAFSGITPLTGGLSLPETQKDLIFLIPNAYFTHKVSPKFAYGVGIFSPFGLGQTYQESPPSIFRNQITKIDLITIVVNPTVAYKVNEYLSIGGGIDFMYGKAKLEKIPVSPVIGNVYQANLDGDGTAWAFNLGALITPTNNIKIGLSYRSPFKLKLHEGDLDIININPAVAGALGPVASNKASTVVNMPATAALGVSYTVNRLTLEVDADFTWWESYRSLDIDVKNEVPGLLVDTVSPKNWNDTIAFYIGGEYRVTDPLSLRAGFRYDPTPVPPSTMGPELPDAIKLYYSVGAGYKYNNWKFDFAYMYVDKRDRTVSNIRTEGLNTVGSSGKWSGSAHLVAFDIGYKF